VILAAFISQLRANAPMFGGRVAGAAEFQSGLNDYQSWLRAPAAYVLPLNQEAEPNITYGGLQQVVHYGVGVAVLLDAQTDRRGQAPAMDLDNARDQVFGAVLNYKIDDCHVARGASFVGGHNLNLDKARLFYQYEFNVDWQITDADGFHIEGVPIERLEVDYWPVPVETGDMPAIVSNIITADGATPPPPTDGPWPGPPVLQRAGTWVRGIFR
jgi:hypothetical protein